MNLARAALVITSLALMAGAPIYAEGEIASDETYRVIVPIMANLTGWGQVRWHGAMRITNPSNREIFVGVTVMEAGYPAFAFSLAAGDSMVFDDIAERAFGVKGRAIALEVTSMGAPVYVEARITGVRPDNSVTTPLAVPAISPEQPSGLRIMGGLGLNAERRTTFGVGNFGEEPVTITIATQRIEGRHLAIASVTIPPLRLFHAPIQAWFPLLGQVDDLSIVVDSPSPSIYAYACDVDNETHNPRFVPATPLSR